MDLTISQLLCIGAAALMVGFTKTSVGGVGILAVLLVALAIPGKASPGILFPMMFAADIMAVIYYRRSCQWSILLSLLPLTFVGVIVGFGLLWVLPDYRFENIIGWLVLTMFGLDLILTETVKQHLRGTAQTAITGVLVGSTSMIANAAGPVFGIYLLQMGLKKHEFVGTRSWFFLMMNLSKFPFAIGLGLVTPDTLTLNAMYLPVILVGAVFGYIFLKFINVEVFKLLVRAAILVAAIRLILT